MAQTDTVYQAAQKVALIAGIPWARVQPYYRALQNDGGKYRSPWLPKSFGRQVWMSHPNYITRLLIALAAASSPEQSHEAVDWATSTTPGGRRRYITELPAANSVPLIESAFFPYLYDPAKAADLINIEFQRDLNRIIFNTRSEGEIVFAVPVEEVDLADKEPAPLGIYTRGVIKGTVFESIAKSIAWRLADEAPWKNSAPEEPAE